MLKERAGYQDYECDLNYKTSQRIKVACDKFFRDSISDEFNRLEMGQ